MSKTVHILVSGKVQGVGFRNFVATHAIGLGVCGWVRNLDDGRVEILASAEAETLEVLKLKAEVGPPAGRVDNLKFEEVELVLNEQNFSVVEDGGEPWSKN